MFISLQASFINNIEVFNLDIKAIKKYIIKAFIFIIIKNFQ